MFHQVMIWVLWIALALGAYVYFVWPVILFILARIAGQRVHVSPPISAENMPHVALLVACFNEENEIETRLDNIASLEYPKNRLVVLVLNDGSTDRTAELVNAYISTNKDLNIVFLDSTENRGKSATLKNGVEWVRKNLPEVTMLAFTDANSQWAVDALSKLIVRFTDRRIGSVSGLLFYNNPGEKPAGSMEAAYWDYEIFLKHQAGALGILPGAVGSIFAMRIDAYHPLSDTRGDDFELPVMAVIHGYKSILAPDALTQEPPSKDFLTEYKRKVRITGQMIPSAWMLFFRALARGRMLMAFQLLSHKLLRYLVPFYQIMLLVSSAFLAGYGYFYLVLLYLQVIFYVLALIGLLFDRSGKHPPKIFQIPLYFTMVNIASLVSIIRAATGQRVKWERNR